MMIDFGRDNEGNPIRTKDGRFILVRDGTYFSIPLTEFDRLKELLKEAEDLDDKKGD